MKLPAHRAGLPGNVDMIIGSALTPVLESVSALPPLPTGRKTGHPADFPMTLEIERNVNPIRFLVITSAIADTAISIRREFSDPQKYFPTFNECCLSRPSFPPTEEKSQFFPSQVSI